MEADLFDSLGSTYLYINGICMLIGILTLWAVAFPRTSTGRQGFPA